MTGSGPVEFEASTSAVSQAALDETGYDLAGVEEVVIEREFEAAGQTREVVVTNYQAEYEKRLDLGPLGEVKGAVFTFYADKPLVLPVRFLAVRTTLPTWISLSTIR